MKIRYSNAETLEFQDASFDVAFAHTIYHHFEDPSKAFREAFRVLRPNGIFYVCVRCGDFRGYRNEGAGNMFYRYYESEEMKTLLLSTGFQIERIELFSDPYGRSIDFIVAIAIKHTFNLPSIATLYSSL
ncbi:MAG: class I SAM-dependent methyltransferase [Candidatus Omnitrophota bacterium]